MAQTAQTIPLGPDDFRRAMASFASGLTVVTAREAGSPFGFTCQSMFSLSLEPPLIAIAAAKSSTSWPSIRRANVICVNVLAHDQAELAQQFSRSGGDKFGGVSWRPSPRGAPVLEGALSWIEATISAVHEAGDHELAVCSVSDLAVFEGNPLLFYRSNFTRIG